MLQKYTGHLEKGDQLIKKSVPYIGLSFLWIYIQ